MISGKQRPPGATRWAIGDGYIPQDEARQSRALESHEALCVLNAGDAPAHVTLHVFYADREPAGPYVWTIDPHRTRHIRMNDLKDPEPIPRATDYSMLIDCDVPIVVQHTRLDSRRDALALLSTIAYASE